MAQARGQFANPKEAEPPPLEAVTRREVKTVIEYSSVCLCVRACVCVTVIFKVYSPVVYQSLLNPIINSYLSVAATFTSKYVTIVFASVEGEVIRRFIYVHNWFISTLLLLLIISIYLGISLRHEVHGFLY
jgi:hypothetical protein